MDSIEAIIKVTQPDKKVAFFKLKEGQTVSIGRRDTCNLTIKDDFLSGEHCTLRIEDGRLIAKDMESKNGTFLNESALTENPVYVGDIVRIGDTTFEFAQTKMSPAQVENFTYNGEKRGTEFLSMSDFKNPTKDGKEIKIELENSIKNNSSHFAEMKEKRKKKKNNEKNKTMRKKISDLLKKK